MSGRRFLCDVRRAALAACALAFGTQVVALQPGGDLPATTPFPPSDAPAPPAAFGSAASVAQGKRLFLSMNCAGCHGYGGAGNMGPDLTDHYWRYGGRPGDIYRTIFGGRPQGMPGFGQAITPEEIWKLVSYVRSVQAPPGGSTVAGTAQPDPGFDTGGTPATHPVAPTQAHSPTARPGAASSPP